MFGGWGEELCGGHLHQRNETAWLAQSVEFLTLVSSVYALVGTNKQIFNFVLKYFNTSIFSIVFNFQFIGSTVSKG